MSVLFAAPVNTTRFVSLVALGTPIRDVVVRGVAAPAPVATPAPAPAQINIAGTWNATLTNCKQSGATVVCIATLRK